jgi:hypothetical protein
MNQVMVSYYVVHIASLRALLWRPIYVGVPSLSQKKKKKKKRPGEGIGESRS